MLCHTRVNFTSEIVIIIYNIIRETYNKQTRQCTLLRVVHLSETYMSGVLQGMFWSSVRKLASRSCSSQLMDSPQSLRLNSKRDRVTKL